MMGTDQAFAYFEAFKVMQGTPFRHWRNRLAVRLMDWLMVIE